MLKVKSGSQRAKSSFTIIEIILAMGLFALAAGGIAGVVVQAFSINRLGEEESYAGFLSSEGIEAARAIGERDFFNLSYGSHGLSTAGGEWSFLGTSNGFGKFTRSVIISKVFRDPAGNVVPSGGTLDLFSRRVESRVTWNFAPGRANTSSTTTYLTHWTEPICTWDSAVQVGGLDLPGGGDGQDIKIVGDKAYVVTRRNGSAGEFFILSLSDPFNPSILGEFEVGDHTSAVAVSGSYAYLATSDSNAELIVVNVSVPGSPTLVAAVDIPDVTQANDVEVLGNYAYVVTQSSSSAGELYAYDISIPSSPSLAGSFETGNHVYGVYVFEDRAYLANSQVDKELVIVDISDPGSMTELGSYDIVSTGANGQSVFYGGGIVHLTTRANAGGTAEYYLLEASDPSDINLIGEFDVSARTNAVEAAVGFSILATEKTDEELMIIDLANPSTPTKVFSLDLGGSAYGVALEECYAYFTSADDGEEIKVTTPE